MLEYDGPVATELVLSRTLKEFRYLREQRKLKEAVGSWGINWRFFPGSNDDIIIINGKGHRV